jgi:hypothetical protein
MLAFTLLGSAGPAVAPAVAQTGGAYDLTWNTLDQGGATFSLGGSYRLGGTIAQPDAGGATGGSYALTGGFWPVTAAAVVGVGDPPAPSEGPPAAFRLLPVVPNPALHRSRISFELPEERAVRVEIFSVSGQRVRTLASGVRPAGLHHALWDGADEAGGRVPAGIYFVSVRAGRAEARSKLVLLQ